MIELQITICHRPVVKLGVVRQKNQLFERAKRLASPISETAHPRHRRRLNQPMLIRLEYLYRNAVLIQHGISCLPAEPVEPTQPTESAEPTEPIESTEP
jgi:hypothetical protein